MAFNSGMEARRKPSARAVSVDRASSFFSDSQTSWVVFNPTELRPHDLLSFSTENPLTNTEDEADSFKEESSNIFPAEESRKASSGLHVFSLPVQKMDELTCDLEASLSRRINEWQKTTDTSVSDNVASWDLDEDLIDQVLDTSILRHVPAYYGDEYFKSMSRIEYIRFKRSSALLKQSLTKNGYSVSDCELMPRLFRLLNWQGLLRSLGSLVDDYIVNTLSRANIQQHVYLDIELSDTATSSSPVMCGGSNSTWNDI